MKERAATLTVFGKITYAAENGAELKALIYALKRITQKCDLLIYTESNYVAAGFRLGWSEDWKRSGWKNAKGKEVANKEEWQELLILLNGQQFDFKVKEEHEYRQWLQREVKRIKEA